MSLKILATATYIR